MNATPDSILADPRDRLMADLQRQLAECRAERDEALARETATAEVLQVINSSPGDLAPVFGAMLEKAMRLSGVVTVSLLVIDDESDVAELFRQCFRREAGQRTYVMQFADSGEDALRKLVGGMARCA